MPNITQLQPEIPNAAQPPQQVGSPLGTPLEQSPLMVTSKRAKDLTNNNLQNLSNLTGASYTLL
jgi:hypothetical protein